MNIDLLGNLFGNTNSESFILQSASDSICLDLTEKEENNNTPWAITIKMENAKLHQISHETVQTLTSSLFKNTQIDKILSQDFLDKKINTLDKICDAIVLIEKENSFELVIVEYKKTITNKTFFPEVLPQLEFSSIKTLLLLNIVSNVSDVKIKHIVTGNLRIEDKIILAKKPKLNLLEQLLVNAKATSKICKVLSAQINDSYLRDSVEMLFVGNKEILTLE